MIGWPAAICGWGYRKRNNTSPGFGWISRHPTSSSRSGSRWMTPVFFWGFCKFTSYLLLLTEWLEVGRMSFQNLGDVVMLWCWIFMIKSANEANKWLHWNWFVTCACLKFVANSIEACLSSMADIIFQCSNPNGPSRRRVALRWIYLQVASCRSCAARKEVDTVSGVSL